MSNKQQNNNSWQACPQGELTRMVQRLDNAQLRAHRKQVLSTALLSTAVFACVVFVVGITMGPDTTHYGGIPCSYCSEHFADYAPHLAEELVHNDPEFVASMKTHLEKCSFCRDKFNAMYPGLLSASRTPATRPAILVALQPAMTTMHRAVYY